MEDEEEEHKKQADQENIRLNNQSFPNQSTLKLSKVSQHPQQSKYPTLLYLACTTPREWTSTLLYHTVPLLYFGASNTSGPKSQSWNSQNSHL
jgi:hypothetical protein